MDAEAQPFLPPAPIPRRTPPGFWETFAIVRRNPLELWGERAFREPHIHIKAGIGGPIVVANDPALIRHLLVDNAANYRFGMVRQKVLRPILRDGLLTAEGSVWRRSRRAVAPVFTPRHVRGFASQMRVAAEDYAARYEAIADRGKTIDLAFDMTELTYEILAETLFSRDLKGAPGAARDRTERLLNTMGRIDPLDLIGAPDFLPRLTRLFGHGALRYFRKLVRQTMDARRAEMEAGASVPDDFLTLLLRAEGPEGLTSAEVEDNIITFIGAGHETTARSLGWTLYLLANAPEERERIEAEIDEVTSTIVDPYDWLAAMPFAKAAFEEAMRLYPPAPSITRAAIGADGFGDLRIDAGTQIVVMPWTVHRHDAYWDRPNHFVPSRFWPRNREAIGRYQFLPFGAGPRVCIGASFAMQEAMIALGVLLSRYRFTTAPGAKPPFPVQKLTTQPEGGLAMRVERR